mgnify:FL=1
MFGHLGFSYVGLIFLLLVFIPNFFWNRHRPVEYETDFESGIFLLLERIGQVGCTISALMFSDFNFAPFTPWTLWLILAFAVMALYEFCWIRYFRSRMREINMYRSFCGIPVPLAVFPTAAFLLLGLYGKVVWLVLFAAVFGVGHIGLQLQHREKCREEARRRLGK